VLHCIRDLCCEMLHVVLMSNLNSFQIRIVKLHANHFDCIDSIVYLRDDFSLC